MSPPVSAQTLATWNMSWLNSTNNSGNAPRKDSDYEALQKYAKRLNADVIAVQEIADEKALERVFGKKGDKFVFHLSEKSPSIQQTGFVIRKGIAFKRLDDFSQLDVTGRLRHGTVIQLPVSGQNVVIMSVHLKSGCFSGKEDRKPTKFETCVKMYRQVVVLEKWIDRMAKGDQPYIILGDFNRRLALTGDLVWPVIDDGKPTNADLENVTRGRKPSCWPDFIDYIDHIIVDPRAKNLVDFSSFKEISYEAVDKRKVKKGPRTTYYPSDHCPISVKLK
jgi:exonuclease III|tara:strand:+ start:2632 stop:3465 length:834 start_codon:yes stop_codon:yes gene_type:complete